MKKQSDFLRDLADPGWRERESALALKFFKDIPVQACNCIGPQGSDPVCPCEMRNVTVVNGRYVKVIDLGTAND